MMDLDSELVQYKLKGITDKKYRVGVGRASNPWPSEELARIVRVFIIYVADGSKISHLPV